jgi:polyhydroxyalkanoate synthase
MAPRLTRGHAALQQRGPHPLPVFLGMAMAVTGGDPLRIARVLAGVRAYQAHAHRAPGVAGRTVAELGTTRLVAMAEAGRPVVLVPSLINGPEVLDLAERSSLVVHLARAGFRPLVVVWGAPDAQERGFDIARLVEARLRPLLADAGEGAPLIGYCLGGTIALAAAALRPPPGLALIATPWRFGGYPADRRAALAELWRGIEPGARATGVVPVELLQPGFWELDPIRSVEKFERFGALDPTGREARHYVEVEDWVNSGPPIGVAAAHDLFERFYHDDEPGSGTWRVGETVVDPSALPCPVLNLVSTRDRLVPADAAPEAGQRIDVDAGHVGMMVGSRAPTLLYEPLTQWLGALPGWRTPVRRRKRGQRPNGESA